MLSAYQVVGHDVKYDDEQGLHCINSAVQQMTADTERLHWQWLPCARQRVCGTAAPALSHGCIASATVVLPQQFLLALTLQTGTLSQCSGQLIAHASRVSGAEQSPYDYF